MVKIMREGRILAAFFSEVAITPEQRSNGLSGRPGMAPDRAMLFILEEQRPVSFWMKGMKFPLDILFFDENKRLINLFPSEQPCETCDLIRSSGPAAYVLEINSGLSKRFDFRKGDRIFFE